jgi:hypothetical protein
MFTLPVRPWNEIYIIDASAAVRAETTPKITGIINEQKRQHGARWFWNARVILFSRLASNYHKLCSASSDSAFIHSDDEWVGINITFSKDLLIYRLGRRMAV